MYCIITYFTKLSFK
uniref:Uncharacterized protein n=1 Tax=Arundo donax TaxID=35708 RepID=A0A0A8Z9G3_ARUDO